jgi:hypothetical protein
MFHCQSIQAFYAEKEMLYNKYSEHCRVHKCKETSNKPECRECNLFKKKFKKPMDPIESFLQKNKTNLLIIGALVLGYLAYKKFNK